MFMYAATYMCMYMYIIIYLDVFGYPIKFHVMDVSCITGCSWELGGSCLQRYLCDAVLWSAKEDGS